MGRLKSRELRVILRFLEEAYTQTESGGLTGYLVNSLQQLFSVDAVSYTVVDVAARRVAWVRKPALPFPDGEQIFAKHMMEHPLIAHRHRTHVYEALSLSDFLTVREFHRTTLYNEFYRPAHLEYQLSVALPASRSSAYISVALSRRTQDFSAYDRLLLNVLRPHLVRIHANTDAATRMQAQLQLIAQGAEQVGYGVVLCSNGRIEIATPIARRWLSEYFEGFEPHDRLPKALEQLVDASRPASAAALPRPREALVVERQGRQLTVRVVTSGPTTMLVLSQKGSMIEPASLQTLGLSRREAEVLGWMSEGKSNAIIGTILGMSTRTVQHHLDRIYRKLGVESRTAAAARAHRLVQTLHQMFVTLYFASTMTA